jgi:hypothetical protein
MYIYIYVYTYTYLNVNIYGSAFGFTAIAPEGRMHHGEKER